MPEPPKITLLRKVTRKPITVGGELCDFPPLDIEAEVYPKHYARFYGTLYGKRLEMLFRIGDFVCYDVKNVHAYSTVSGITRKHILVYALGEDHRLPFYDAILLNHEVNQTTIRGRWGATLAPDALFCLGIREEEAEAARRAQNRCPTCGEKLSSAQ